MIPPDWMPHRRRDDGELVGYLVLEGEGFVPFTVFGHQLSDALDLDDAETLLEERGLGILADRWVWHNTQVEGRPEMFVRIVEVTPERVRVVDDDTGAAAVVGGNLSTYDLPVPTDGLRPA